MSVLHTFCQADHITWIIYSLTYYFNLPPSQLIKLDTRTKQTKLWQEEGCNPSEPVFVARPGATDEDDGK